jgi:hypothetical protein
MLDVSTVIFVTTFRLLFHGRAALIKTATAFRRAAVPFAAGLLSTSRCNGLGGDVLMLALLHKRIYEKKRRHHYWVRRK